MIDAFVACEQSLEVQSKPIVYLLAKYGVNVDAMISQKLQVSDQEVASMAGAEDNQAILIRELSGERPDHGGSV